MPSSPWTPGSVTSFTVSWTSGRSGVTISSVRCVGRAIPSSSGVAHLLGRGEDVLDAAGHVERALRDVVVLAVDDLLEALDRVGDRHVLALQAGELLGDEERLREEPLDLAGPGHRQLVVFGQLVDAEDGDDVLEVLVALQHLLHRPGDPVVLVAEDA